MLRPGTELAGHRIEWVAGRGGWSVVYNATQLSLNRAVALKVIAPELADSGDFRERFQRECEIAASLDHPNVLPIHNAGDEDGVLYVAMRYVDGTTLSDLLAGGPLDPARAVAIVAQVADALDAAHARGLVHRDVKPGNILVELHDGREHAYLSDFGLTKEISDDPGLTEAGRWLGTVDYAAPEQIRGEPLDGHADVYSLGGTLYRALTGEVPYPRETVEQTMRAHLEYPPPAAPPPFYAAIARAMAKDRGVRFQTAGEFSRAVLGVTR